MVVSHSMSGSFAFIIRVNGVSRACRGMGAELKA
jgi:hypothetical protein